VSNADKVARYQARVEAAIARRLPPVERAPQRLHAAMRYATLGGGKRIRPLLVYFTGEVLGVEPTRLDGPAAAVELIHAYSLVHDDLPSMDDDDLRRGRPTCHRAFDEATAILVGDALQVLAFEILARDPDMVDEPALRLRMIAALAQAAGPAGMAGGQAVDIEATGGTLTLEQLEQMHRLKTGALICASVALGALSAPGLPAERLAHLERFAECAGLAFQVQDDILDVEGDAATLGKSPGADQARNKPTYPSIAGIERAKRRARELHEQALGELTVFGAAAEPLRWLSAYIIERRH
jgi:geranylgeranyl diphosphate synthase, type II